MAQPVTLPADWERQIREMVRRMVMEMVDQALRERLPLAGTETDARFLELLDRRFEQFMAWQDKRFEALVREMDKRFEALMREMDARFQAAAQERKAILDMMNKGFEAAAQERKAILQRLEGLQRQMNFMLALFGIWLSLLSLLAGWIALYR